MITIPPVSLTGLGLGPWTGHESAEAAKEQVGRLAQEAIASTLDQEEGRLRGQRALERETRRWMLARHHLEIGTRINNISRMIIDAESAERRGQQSWRDLTNASLWHAAHHRFVLAYDDARDNLETAISASQELHRHVNRGGHFGIQHTEYLAEMPVGPRVALPSTTSIEGELSRLTETFRGRFELTAATSAGRLPVAFMGAETMTAEEEDEPTIRTARTPASARRVELDRPDGNGRHKAGQLPDDFVATPAHGAAVVELPAGDVPAT